MMTGALATTLREIARPLAGTPSDFDPVLAAAGAARFVLIGEASLSRGASRARRS